MQVQSITRLEQVLYATPSQTPVVAGTVAKPLIASTSGLIVDSVALGTSFSAIQQVSITNIGAATVFIGIQPASAVAGNVTSTQYHLSIAAGATLNLACSTDIVRQLWLVTAAINVNVAVVFYV